MRRAPLLSLPAALLLAIGTARADLPQPACEAIAQWAQGYDRAETWSPNALGGRGRFSALFADPATPALFGKPVLDWTPDESRALAEHLASCAETLRRAGNRTIGTPLVRLRANAQREVPAYLTALAEAREAVPRLLAALAEEAPSVSLLRLHQTLAAIAAGPEPAQANQVLQGLRGEVRSQARALLAALRNLPQAEIVALLTPAGERVPALRDAVRDALLAEVAAVPDSLAGLRALDRLARGQPEQAEALGEASAAQLEAGFAARRQAIGLALREDLLGQVAAVSANAPGAYRLDQLRQQAAQQYAEAIGPEGVSAVEAAIATRREAIGAAMVEEVLGNVAGLAATPASLRLLHGLETQAPNPTTLGLMGPEGIRRVREAAAARRLALGAEVAADALRQIAAVPAAPEGFAALDRLTPPQGLALLPPAEATRLTEAAATRRGAIAEAVLPGFRAELARLPAADESLTLIDAEVLGGIAAWPDSAAAEKALFAAVAQERRAVILATVNRAEAGPLNRRIYEGAAFRLEFLDGKRVVVTAPGEAPEAGTYAEEADGRVIVAAGGRSIVMTREGRRLVAGPITVQRVK